MITFLRGLLAGTLSLLGSGSVTVGRMFRPPVTLEYPRDGHRLPMSSAYRGAIRLIHFEEKKTHDCIACKACAIICPSQCIEVDGSKAEGQKRKVANRFWLDYTTCSECNLCIEVCPTDTLHYSMTYDAAHRRLNPMRHDLLEEFARQHGPASLPHSLPHSDNARPGTVQEDR